MSLFYTTQRRYFLIFFFLASKTDVVEVGVSCLAGVPLASH
jgi:hypothetical protein